MTVGENLILNPSGDDGLNNWTVSGSVTVNGGFIFTSDSSISQTYTIETLPDPLPAKYRITATFENASEQNRTAANFNKKISATLYYESGLVEYLVVPLRIDITPPDHMTLTWYHVHGEIELADPETEVLDHIVVKVSCGTITEAVTVKDIYLVTLTDDLDSTIQEFVESALQNSLYAGELSKLNELAANAQGYYVTYDTDPVDGSIIYYQHDEPNIVDSILIYKMTADGFFWTDQGWDYENTVWTSGYTAEGNIVAKTLSVIGINADWIVTGSISSTNNYTQINLDNGSFSFANGLLVFENTGWLETKYLSVHPADNSEAVTFKVEGRASFDDTVYHYAYSIPIEAQSGDKPFLGDSSHHWGAIYADKIYSTESGTDMTLHISAYEPSNPYVGMLWLDISGV